MEAEGTGILKDGVSSGRRDVWMGVGRVRTGEVGLGAF